MDLVQCATSCYQDSNTQPRELTVFLQGRVKVIKVPKAVLTLAGVAAQWLVCHVYILHLFSRWSIFLSQLLFLSSFLFIPLSPLTLCFLLCLSALFRLSIFSSLSSRKFRIPYFLVLCFYSLSFYYSLYLFPIICFIHFPQHFHLFILLCV
jgi:hypothetical protein